MYVSCIQIFKLISMTPLMHLLNSLLMKYKYVDELLDTYFLMSDWYHVYPKKHLNNYIIDVS